MTSEDLLGAGIQAIKEGRKRDARALLEQVVEEDDSNWKGWLCLSLTQDDPDEERACLDKVLAIQPGNEPALEQLEKLEGLQAEPDKTSSADSRSMGQSAEEPGRVYSFTLCPHCDKLIQAEAKVCQHCGIDLKTEEDQPYATPGQVYSYTLCPYCAELIKAEAIVCKHCGRDLEADAVRQIAERREPATTAPEEKESLGVGDILLGFALPIVGLILAVVYLTRARSRERGLLLIVVSLVAWAVWWVICSWTGALSGF
jgi:hypothetical protein